MWSPQTAPANTEDIDITKSFESAGNIAVTIGINIAKVPHDVPVANANPKAMTNSIAGNIA